MKKIIALVFVSLFVFGIVKADISEEAYIEEVLSSFRSIASVSFPDIKVPTVVEVPFGNNPMERLGVAIKNVTDDTFVPYYLINNKSGDSVFTASSAQGKLPALTDNNSSSVQFDVTENGGDVAVITLTSKTPITASGIVTELADMVSIPKYVAIKAGGKILVAKKEMISQTVSFPETTSTIWQIEFFYSQPLRIENIRFIETVKSSLPYKAVRFLAYPKNDYKIYFNQDRSASINTSIDTPDLVSNTDVKKVALSSIKIENNQAYKIADNDGDNVADINDNCVYVANADQDDVDDNGRGDVCDDFDKDGSINADDNCPDITNRNQKDVDADGIGDVCDDEEGRVTERLPWLPWVGIGLALLVVIGLFILSAHSMMKKKEDVVSTDQGNENFPPQN